MKKVSGGEYDRFKAYRVRDLLNFTNEYGHLNVLPYELIIRVLDHVEVGLDRQMKVYSWLNFLGKSCNLVQCNKGTIRCRLFDRYIPMIFTIIYYYSFRS